MRQNRGRLLETSTIVPDPQFRACTHGRRTHVRYHAMGDNEYPSPRLKEIYTRPSEEGEHPGPARMATNFEWRRSCLTVRKLLPLGPLHLEMAKAGTDPDPP